MFGLRCPKEPTWRVWCAVRVWSLGEAEPELTYWNLSCLHPGASPLPQSSAVCFLSLPSRHQVKSYSWFSSHPFIVCFTVRIVVETLLVCEFFALLLLGDKKSRGSARQPAFEVRNPGEGEEHLESRRTAKPVRPGEALLCSHSRADPQK